VSLGALLLLTCAAGERTWDQPAGAHIRAALGTQPVRNLGASSGHISAWLDRQDGTWLEIQAYEFLDEDTDATLFLAVPNPRAGKRWTLGRSADGAWTRYTIHDITPDHVVSYGSVRDHSGSLVLGRFDEKKRIVEGTFEFVGAAGAETLRVSRGSFKLRVHSTDANGRALD
jgi:hypothetical protein